MNKSQKKISKSTNIVRRTAALGCEEAMYNLGVMYEKGLVDLSRNFKKAKRVMAGNAKRANS